MDPLPQPPELPGYRLDRQIGEGGFGQVWRAFRESDGARVAIKVLHAELVASNDATKRFERELVAIGSLAHPNVVRAEGHGTLEDGRPYVVLEYVEGPSLREVIAQRGTLPPNEMLAILGPLCEALGTAHAAGLVHRDVKASNVLIETATGRPVLLDFGLVKVLGDDGSPELTSSRAMLGTPAAMAPEQLRGGRVDARTDIYALGLMAYHMLTGQPAFGGGPGVVASFLQVHGPRPRPSSKADLDPAIDEPIIKALAPEPKDRFASAHDFLVALRGAIEPAPPAQAGSQGEVEVIALYVESFFSVVQRVADIAARVGMSVAWSAPDSFLAVIPRNALNASELGRIRTDLANTNDPAKIALGLTRASIDVHVDGPALDVESWAPYPLPDGLWVAEGL